MRVLCCLNSVELHVPEHALSRSILLADIYSSDPEGCAPLPCDRRTWEVWLSDDAAKIHDVEVLLAVCEVR